MRAVHTLERELKVRGLRAKREGVDAKRIERGMERNEKRRWKSGDASG